MWINGHAWIVTHEKPVDVYRLLRPPKLTTRKWPAAKGNRTIFQREALTGALATEACAGR